MASSTIGTTAVLDGYAKQFGPALRQFLAGDAELVHGAIRRRPAIRLEAEIAQWWTHAAGAFHRREWAEVIEAVETAQARYPGCVVPSGIERKEKLARKLQDRGEAQDPKVQLHDLLLLR